MTRDQYIKIVEGFQQEYDQLMKQIGEVVDKENNLKEEYIKENKPYPEGTVVLLRLRREDGTPRRSIIGKVQCWFVGKKGEFRPHFDGKPYSWHDEIISIEEYDKN